MDEKEIYNIGSITNKNGSSKTRFRYVERNGKRFCDIRQWYKDKETGNFLPTRKGVSLPIDNVDDAKKLKKAFSLLVSFIEKE